MIRADLINQVAEKTSLSPNDAKAAVNAVFGCITEALANGESVNILGFGTFEVKTRAAREAKNPRNGEKISVPATRVAHFKVGSKLKEAVK